MIIIAVCIVDIYFTDCFMLLLPYVKPPSISIDCIASCFIDIFVVNAKYFYIRICKRKVYIISIQSIITLHAMSNVMYLVNYDCVTGLYVIWLYIIFPDMYT